MTPAQIRKQANDQANFALQPSQFARRDDMRRDAALRLMGEFVAQTAELNELLSQVLLQFSTADGKRAK